MDTEVVGVPQGSGLGTSSILAAACVKALFEFTGIRYTESDLYGRVLCMEQMMGAADIFDFFRNGGHREHGNNHEHRKEYRHSFFEFSVCHLFIISLPKKFLWN